MECIAMSLSNSRYSGQLAGVYSDKSVSSGSRYKSQQAGLYRGVSVHMGQ